MKGASLEASNVGVNFAQGWHALQIVLRFHKTPQKRTSCGSCQWGAEFIPLLCCIHSPAFCMHMRISTLFAITFLHVCIHQQADSLQSSLLFGPQSCSLAIAFTVWVSRTENCCPTEQGPSTQCSAATKGRLTLLRSARTFRR